MNAHRDRAVASRCSTPMSDGQKRKYNGNREAARLRNSSQVYAGSKAVRSGVQLRLRHGGTTELLRPVEIPIRIIPASTDKAADTARRKQDALRIFTRHLTTLELISSPSLGGRSA